MTATCMDQWTPQDAAKIALTDTVAKHRFVLYAGTHAGAGSKPAGVAQAAGVSGDTISAAQNGSIPVELGGTVAAGAVGAVGADGKLVARTTEEWGVRVLKGGDAGEFGKIDWNDQLIYTTITGAEIGDGEVDEDALAASVAGDGLAGGAGDALTVNVDDVTIEIDESNGVQVKNDSLGVGKLAAAAKPVYPLDISIDAADIADAGVVSFTLKSAFKILTFQRITESAISTEPCAFTATLSIDDVDVTGGVSSLAAASALYAVDQATITGLDEGESDGVVKITFSSVTTCTEGRVRFRVWVQAKDAAA